MNSEDLTLSLNEPTPGAPSTQPLMKELMADVRELKANSVTKTEFAYLVSVVERIEKRLDGIECEQRLSRHGMDTANLREHRRDERIMELEKSVFGEFNFT